MNNPRTDPGVRCLERDRISGRLESEHRPSEARHARQGGLQRGGRSTAGANRGSSNGPYRYTSSFSLITVKKTQPAVLFSFLQKDRFNLSLKLIIPQHSKSQKVCLGVK